MQQRTFTNLVLWTLFLCVWSQWTSWTVQRSRAVSSRSELATLSKHPHWSVAHKFLWNGKANVSFSVLNIFAENKKKVTAKTNLTSVHTTVLLVYHTASATQSTLINDAQRTLKAVCFLKHTATLTRLVCSFSSTKKVLTKTTLRSLHLLCKRMHTRISYTQSCQVEERATKRNPEIQENNCTGHLILENCTAGGHIHKELVHTCFRGSIRNHCPRFQSEKLKK